MQTVPESDPADAQPAAPDAAAAAPAACDAFPRCPAPLRHPFAAAAWLVALVAGLVSLVALLAVIAAIPVANLVALGYMLEGEGRVVRSGRLRDGLPLAALLPRLGAIAGGTWACLLVVRLVAGAAADAALVDPGGPVATAWQRAATLTAVLVGVHLLLAWHAGGSLASFVRPLRNLRLLVRAVREGTVWSGAADRLAATLGLIRPLRLFTLGLRGFLGSAVWLVPATLVFSAFRDTQQPVALLVTLGGALVLGAALVGVPIMQALFAADGRLTTFRDVAAVRRLFRRAPWALVAAVVVLHALSLPLYLAKVVVPPRDALWLVTPIFVLTIYPARLVVGLATGYARRRTRDRWAVVRWAALAVLAPLLALDLLLLFFMPAIDALGRQVLFDHHALLLPTPF